MRCLAICQTELVIRMLDEILLPSFEVDFLVESKPVARRLHDAGMNVAAADLGRNAAGEWQVPGAQVVACRPPLPDAAATAT